jgi:beta-glucosidase
MPTQSPSVAPARCAVEPLERRTLLSDGGGLTNAGLRGDYFANESLSGQPAFTRNDVRVDFDWGLAAPGGSPDAPYNAVGADHFSVRWSGQLIPRYSEPYVFIVRADDGARLSIRPAGAGSYTKLSDTFAGGTGLATRMAVYRMRAGQAYDVNLEYR